MKRFGGIGIYRDDLLNRCREVLKSLRKMNGTGIAKPSVDYSYTEDEGNGFIVKDLYFSGVPILMLISPDGITLARGYTKAYEEVKNLLDRNLGNK